MRITTAARNEQCAVSNAGARLMAQCARLNAFGKFKPEVSHEVRKADVETRKAIENTREMLRSMTPEQLMQMIEFRRVLTFFEAVELAKQGYLIVPNDIHDRILMATADLEYLQQNYPVWSGTLVIYEKP